MTGKWIGTQTNGMGLKMKNDSSVQPLDLKLFKANQDKAVSILEKCALTSEAAKNTLLRIASSTDEYDLPEASIKAIAFSAIRLIDSAVQDMDVVKELTAVDISKQQLVIKGISVLVSETIRFNHIRAIQGSCFYVAHQVVELFCDDLNELMDEIIDSKNMIISAHNSSNLGDQTGPKKRLVA